MIAYAGSNAEDVAEDIKSADSQDSGIVRLYSAIVFACHKKIGYYSEYRRLRQSYDAGDDAIPRIQRDLKFLGAE